MPLDFARDKRGLFLAAFFVIALLTKTDPGSAHELSRYGTVESLVDRGTFQLDDSSFIGSVDKIYRDGHYYSHQPPLLAVLEAPVYWAINLPGIRFNNRGRFVMTYLFILLTNGIALALTVVMFAKILEEMDHDIENPEWMAALMVFSTWLLPYGVISNNHGVAALLVTVLIYLLLRLSEAPTAGEAAAIGLTLGLLVAIELLPVIAFVPLVLIYLFATSSFDGRSVGALGVGLAVPLIAHAMLNVQITGDVIPAGFHHELFRYPGSVFEDSMLTGTIKYDSLGALAAYAWTSMFAGKGFLTFSPMLLLAVVAGLTTWHWWARARGLQVVLLGSITLSLGAALATTNNYGGEAVGFRHATYLIPAFLALLVPWLRTPKRRLVTATAWFSAWWMLLFAVRQPWSVLTLSNAPIGSWDQYLPLLGKIVSGNLFNP